MASQNKKWKMLLPALMLMGTISCAADKLTPIGKQADFLQEDDERRLWTRAEEEQQRLDNSRLIYNDPELNEYINRVAQRLVPDEVKKEKIAIRVRVIKSPFLNAFTYPNGVIYIHTGLLAQMENEAQLATLLGHEMSHAIQRHAVQEARNIKQKTAIGSTFAVAIPIVGLLSMVGANAAITGFSRDQEREADRDGLILTVQSGYDPAESPKLFVALQKEIKAQKEKEPFFFGTHPRLQERIDSYNEIIKKRGYKGGEKNEEAFMTHIFPLLIENVQLDLSMGRLDLAQKTIERALKLKPDHSKTHYLLGEVYRQKGQPDNLTIAVEEYRQAIQFDGRFAGPHRGLGMIRMKEGDPQSAKQEFQTYLSLDPQAEDKGYIEQYLQDLNPD